jgi:hypothetical protein
LTATLIVRVLASETHAPLRSVHVSVFPKNHAGGDGAQWVDRSKGTRADALRPDESGSCEFTLAPGDDLTVLVHGDNEQSGSDRQNIPALALLERREVVVELPTQADLAFFGRVVSRADGHPVIDARIRAIRSQLSFARTANGSVQDQWSEEELGAAVSDSDGRFDFRLESWKRPHLRVEADGYSPSIVVPLAGHASPNAAQLVPLDAAARIKAHVLDSAGGAVPEARVVLMCQGYLSQLPTDFSSSLDIPDPEWAAVSDSQGWCFVEGLSPEVKLTVRVDQRGQTILKDDRPIVLKSGETRELELRVGSSCRLTGSVLDQEGKPVGSQELWLLHAQRDQPRFLERFDTLRDPTKTRTDEKGRFAFENVLAGKWWLAPALIENPATLFDPGAVAPLTTVVEIPADATSFEVVVKVQRGLFIGGRVLDSEEKPVPKAGVFARSTEGSCVVNVQANEAGEFAAGPLVPGEYALAAGANGFSISQMVKANCGDRDVLLRLRSGGAISGNVTMADTGSSSVASVVAAMKTEEEDGFHMRGSGDDGSFKFDGLKPGDWSVTAYTTGGLIGVARGVTVRSGVTTEHILVRLEPGGRVRIRYEGEANYASFRLRSMDCYIAGAGVARGTSVVQVVPAGQLSVYRLPSGTGRGFKQRVVEVGVGEEKELVFHDED